MRRVIWSPGSLEDLGAIRTYVLGFSPKAAGRLIAALLAEGESLEHFADRGRPIRPGLRELVLVKPYLVRYVVMTDEVWILSIRHAARRPAS